MKFFKKATAISLAILSTVSTTTFVSAGKAKPELPPSPLKRCRTTRSQLRYSRNRQLLKRNPKLLEALGGTSKINRMSPCGLDKEIEKHLIKSRINRKVNCFLSCYLADDVDIDGQTIDTVIDNVNNTLAHELRSNLNVIGINSNGGNVIIVGDTHGDFDSTNKIIKYFLKEFKKNPNEKILFLGDYVDRGDNNVKNFIVICALKAAFPNNVYMIRGNHEDLPQNANTNVTKSLFNEFDTRYGNCGGSATLAPKFASVYNILPLSAVLDGKVFCVHGGIPRPSDDPNYFQSGQYALDLLWSDPDISNAVYEDNEDGYIDNIYRDEGILFNNKLLKDFLDQNQFQGIVRAHQAVNLKDSYAITQKFENKLLTVFSAKNHRSISGPKTEGFVIIYNSSKFFYKTIDHLLIS